MSQSGYYTEDDDIDVRVRRRRDYTPPRPQVVQRQAPVRGYYSNVPAVYPAEQRTVAVFPRSRSRSRSRERRSTPPPVVINNYNTQHSGDESDDDGHGQLVARRRHRSHSRAPSNDFMSREEYELEKARRELEDLKLRYANAKNELETHIRRNDAEDWQLAQAQNELVVLRNEEYERERRLRMQEEADMARAKQELDAIKAEQDQQRTEQQRRKAYKDNSELEQAKRELDAIKAEQERQRIDQQRRKEYKDKTELEQAKRELDAIRQREERELEEQRIKKSLELKALEEQKRAQDEKDRRDKMEKEAIERYKAKEAERIAKEAAEQEEADREYKRRLQEDLLRSGVNESDIKAILEKKSIKQEKKEEKKPQTDVNIGIGNTVAITAPLAPTQGLTYTRMARRHLSIETLNQFHVNFEYDPDPEYILVKRWVPEDERLYWWQHTKTIREKRKTVIKIEGERSRHHHRLEPEFEWVRKKERRHSRSKSPGLLMYLAGAK
ncbi:hypothetical protein SEPCBS119000_001085 [Sporothrix epigloea]|uniref:Uncharacterized protein n=1 Tax=Sporothrix epigloea TaxID=1892477 RepID=A0ABP0D8S4_9PEZI